MMEGNTEYLMKTQFILLVFAFIFTGMLTSCSISDDEIIKAPIVATSGDIDDPVEPDREEN